MARPGVFDSAWFEHNKQAVERATKGTSAWALVHLYRWLNDMEHHGWDVELEREALAILARENQSAATDQATAAGLPIEQAPNEEMRTPGPTTWTEMEDTAAEPEGKYGDWRDDSADYGL